MRRRRVADLGAEPRIEREYRRETAPLKPDRIRFLFDDLRTHEATNSPTLLRMKGIVVFEPCGQLHDNDYGVRQRVHRDANALEGFDQGFGHSVRLGAANGVENGSMPISMSRRLVSLAMKQEPLSVSHSIGFGRVLTRSKRFSTAVMRRSWTS